MRPGSGQDERMRRMLFLLSLSGLSLALPGCLFTGDDDGAPGDDATDGADGSDGGDGGDGSDGDDGGEPDCVGADLRDELTASLAGEVIDHETGEPIAGAEVSISTAWDTSTAFPAAECPILATLTTGGDGGFGPADVALGSALSPPIPLFLVTGDDVADTASDQRMECDASGCEDVTHGIAAPARDLVAGWRSELARGGMDDADSRGLVLFAFFNTDGTPAEGVTLWSGVFQEEPLAPDSEVRFLEADRLTLAPPGTDTTTASGLALIGVDTDDYAGLFVSGTRGSDHWDETGVLLAPGWVFLEDKQQSP
jgi:hypothetical protein